jgi:hypothetical protein
MVVDLEIVLGMEDRVEFVVLQLFQQVVVAVLEQPVAVVVVVVRQVMVEVLHLAVEMEVIHRLLLELMVVAVVVK